MLRGAMQRPTQGLEAHGKGKIAGATIVSVGLSGQMWAPNPNAIRIRHNLFPNQVPHRLRCIVRTLVGTDLLLIIRLPHYTNRLLENVPSTTMGGVTNHHGCLHDNPGLLPWYLQKCL